MYEIKLTLDATSALIGALQGLAGAIRDAAHPVAPLPPSNLCGLLTPKDRPAGLREGIEKDDAAEKALNLPSEAPVDAERTETLESTEAPKKRKPRAKKAPSDSADSVTPSAGDDLSPIGANEEPAKAVADPAPVGGAAPSHEQKTGPDPDPEAAPMGGTDPLAGKGQTGEILAELTRKAIGDLDALGVDRGDANHRIRDYCARNEIKFPTFPALLQAVGYAEAIAICKGAGE